MGAWTGLTPDKAGEEDYLYELGNISRNLNPIWAKSMGYCLFEMRGWEAKDMIMILKLGLARIESMPDEYTYEAWAANKELAAHYLAKAIEACCQYPEAYYRYNG